MDSVTNISRAKGEYRDFESAFISGLSWGINNLLWGNRLPNAVQAQKAYQWSINDEESAPERHDLLKTLLAYLSGFEIEPDEGRSQWLQTYIADKDAIRMLEK